MITSRDNPTVKLLASLREAKGREKAGLALAEGPHLAQEAFKSGVKIKLLALSESAERRAECAALLRAAEAAGVEVARLSDSCYAKLSDLRSPEGVAVAFARTARDLGQMLNSGARLAVAAGVQDPGNAGAIARAAEAAGASGAVFLGGVDVDGPKFIRAAMGSSFRLPCVRAETTEFLAAAKNAGLRLLACAAENSRAGAAARTIDFRRADYSAPAAVCVGGEGAGLPDELLHAVAETVFIPMRGAVESLNAAVAAGIILHHAWAPPPDRD